ncbi:hypothetical protein ACFV84_14965 [Kitasatospora sp. NPDC059811]|uniref:hypothetical protein n=1 Tax=Kitasatospora sp. NPDC059811 TaxID=3346957 RepID=UPI003649CCA2
MSSDHDAPHRQQPTLLEAVAGLEAVAAAGDDDRFGPALALVGGLFGSAGPAEAAAAGPRLAALLPGAPPFPRAHLAMVVGACVENGADPVGCAGPVLAGLHGALTGTQRLTRRWAQTGGGPLPDPEGDDPGEAHDRVADPAHQDAGHAHLGGGGGGAPARGPPRAGPGGPPRGRSPPPTTGSRIRHTWTRGTRTWPWSAGGRCTCGSGPPGPCTRTRRCAARRAPRA